MVNINFVPDDYVRSKESRRTNMLYLVLLAVVMAGLGGVFLTIKVRQHALKVKDDLLNAKLAQAREAIEQFEELQSKRKAMMKTALTTAELLEPVPRSILLAELTNNLPTGASLVRVKFVQKEPRRVTATTPTSNYQKGQAPKSESAGASKEKFLETFIDIEGVAPSDLQVASYIEQLSNSALLQNVALVESKEHNIDEVTFRQFTLTAKLKKDVHLTDDDVKRIRTKAERTARNF